MRAIRGTTDMSKVIMWVILALFALFVLYPFWIGILGALKTTKQFSEIPVFLPSLQPTIEPVLSALAQVWRPIITSALVAATTMVLSVGLGIVGGYLLAHTHFRGSGVLLAICVFGIYIPGVTRLIPLIELTQALGLYNTPWGVGIAIGSIQLPLATILYLQFFKQIPRAFFEVAEINGADHFQILRYLVVPLSKVPSVTVAILSFAQGWNDLLFSLVITSGSARTRPVTVMISNLMWEAQRYSTFNLLLAGSIIVAIPTVLLYLGFQQYVTAGFRQMGEGGK